MDTFNSKRNVIFVSHADSAFAETQELLANGSITPGDLLVRDLTASKPLVACLDDNFAGPVLIADLEFLPDIEDFRSGEVQTDIAYSDGETVYFRQARQGDRIQVRSTNAVAVGDILTSNGATIPGHFIVNAAPTAGTIQLLALVAQATVGELVTVEVL